MYKDLKDKLQNKKNTFVANEINKLNLPKSMLIIPDGNGRWAKKLGLSVIEGHKEGGRNLAKILDNLVLLNIKVLGIWGFSEDNWKRSKQEINNLMEVYANFMEENIEKLNKNNIKFLCIGNKDRIKKEYPQLFNTIQKITSKTSHNNGKILGFFLDYGERYQLEEFAKERIKNKNLTTYQVLSKINFGIPLFDMVLRTSGELRFSGFGPLAGLAELISVKKNLPELSSLDIAKALRQFSQRNRRFGARI